MPGLFCSGMGAPLCRSRMDSHCTDRRGVQRGKAPLALGHPIGASSIPVGKGSLEGNSVPLGGRFPKEGSAFLGTRLSLGKSSVLYLCFRLTRERGWRRTLRCGRVWQQTLFRGSRTGGFCDGGLRHKRRIFEKQNPTGRKRRQRYIKPPSRRSAAFVSVFLPLPFAMGHGRFPALADGAFQVFGQLQHLNQVDKLFHCDGIVIDP